MTFKATSGKGTSGKESSTRSVLLFTLLGGICLLGGWGLWAALGGDESPPPVANAAADSAQSRGSLPKNAPWGLAGRGDGATARGESRPVSSGSPAEPDSRAGAALEVAVASGTRPLPGAQIRLYQRGATDPNTNEVAWPVAGEGVTGEDGIARLKAGPGHYMVVARQGALAPANRTFAIAHGEEAKRVSLTLTPGLTLTGRTLEHGRRDPVPLAQLVLTPVEPASRAWQRPSAPEAERVPGESDERGRFRIDGLSAGTWELRASAPGHSQSEPMRIEVPAKGELVVELKASGVLEGFVLDAGGKPADGAQVMATGGQGAEPAVSDTGPGGGFSLEVGPGTWRLTAKRRTESAALDAPVTVGPGKTVRDLRLRLGPGAAFEGRVLSADDREPIAGAAVAVSPFREAGDSGRAVTGPDGAWMVEGLPPGSYDVVVNAEGFGEAMRRGLTLLAGQRVPLDIELSGTGAVEGVVTDDAGAPVRGATVLSSGDMRGAERPPVEALTDAQGRYRLAPMESGPARLMVRANEEDPWVMQRVTVPPGGTAEANFKLSASGTIAGKVLVGESRRIASGASVRAAPRGRGAGFSATTAGDDGTFRLRVLPGRYVVSAAAGEMRPSRSGGVEVTVEAGQTAEVEVVMAEESDGVSGTVVEPDDGPSPRAVVTATVNGAPLGWAMADDEGKFSLPPLKAPPDTTVTLTARSGGRTGRLALTRLGGSGAVVRLERAASITGRVRAADGLPVTSIWARAVSTDMPGFTPELQFHGEQFVLDDVPTGKVRLRVRTDDGRVGDAELTLHPGARERVDLTLGARSAQKPDGEARESRRNRNPEDSRGTRRPGQLGPTGPREPMAQPGERRPQRREPRGQRGGMAAGSQ